ncbi:hypothetical protein BD410DRAFT_786880 [Rickenella mellea]|uniref:Uncharacterized protein n=1 Tax=Rickenella mellea TaxID=50990 RepID=A0A4Y7Q953_9AGAM|nr:hypothetical protein BD410DRAFT_786880 [Rickenella mellea]
MSTIDALTSSTSTYRGLIYLQGFAQQVMSTRTVGVTIRNDTEFHLNIVFNALNAIPFDYTNSLQPGRSWESRLAVPLFLPLTSIDVYYDQGENQTTRHHLKENLAHVLSTSSAMFTAAGVAIVAGVKVKECVTGARFFVPFLQLALLCFLTCLMYFGGMTLWGAAQRKRQGFMSSFSPIRLAANRPQLRVAVRSVDDRFTLWDEYDNRQLSWG